MSRAADPICAPHAPAVAGSANPKCSSQHALFCSLSPKRSHKPCSIQAHFNATHSTTTMLISPTRWADRALAIPRPWQSPAVPEPPPIRTPCQTHIIATDCATLLQCGRPAHDPGNSQPCLSCHPRAAIWTTCQTHISATHCTTLLLSSMRSANTVP